MEQTEKKFFGDPNQSGRLNSDDAPFSIGENEWVNAENVRVGSTDAGVINTDESIGSNVLRSTPQPSVTFLEIGSADDSPNNRFFVFKYNTTGTQHKITYYDIDNQTEYDVLLSSQVVGGLTFSKDYPIHSARVVGNLLYWTDNYNQPRRINVDAAIKLNNPSYVTDEAAYTAPMNQSVITIIRRAYGSVPTLSFSTDITKGNFLKEFAGQFAIGFVYRDGEESVFGQPSKMANYRYDFGTFSGTSSDPNNKLTVTLPSAATGESIDQDVEIVQLAVRYDNSPQYFIIKEWNKNNTTDAAAIIAFNAGGSLSFDFYNDKTGVPASTERSVRPFDRVPLLSEALETGLQRLFLGNNLLGYDTPPQTSLIGNITPATVTGTATPIFHSFSSYQIGVRFRDEYKRSSGVVTNSALAVVPIPARGDWDVPTFVENINWTLSNSLATLEIPDWAYYYDILITKNLRTRSFLQFFASSLRYAVKNIDGTYTYQTNFSSNVTGLAFNASSVFQNGMGISLNVGDKVLVYLDGGTAPIVLSATDLDSFYLIASPISGNMVFQFIFLYGVSE